MLFTALSLVAGVLAGETADTLVAANVVADRGIVVSRMDTVKISNSISITEVLSKTPGLYVGDNGGAAGLKTVSLRGLGSAHTAIYIDGVRVGNIQSGQTDLGMLDLENCSEAVIDYAQNSLSFQTRRTSFSGSPVAGAFRFRAGSFGTYEPAARLDFKLSEKLCLSATTNATFSKGDFPVADGRRTNNDIKQIRSGLDFWGTMSDGDWNAKAYFSGADRGTPGSLSWPSTDRQKDRNAFVQGLVRKQFSTVYQMNLSAKAAFDDLEYFSEWGDNRYRQTELQLNSSHKFSIKNWLDASLAADFQWDGLNSDLYEKARTTVITSAAVCFHPDKFKADISLEYSGIFDRDGGRRNCISPAVDLRWDVLQGFAVTAFARKGCRVPTFNELYYPGFGNPDLKTEDATMTDLGLEYCRDFSKNWRVSVKADGFYNYLKDKIVSAPTIDDPNIWLPFNVGIVEMTGADIQGRIGYAGDLLEAGFSARYSLQNAIDKTPDSWTYGEQIPYIAKNSIHIAADASMKGWQMELSWNHRGGRRDSAGEMPDYHTLNFSAGKDFRLGKGMVLGLKAMAANLTDCRYELASGHPMPGRSFFGEINFKF